MAEYDNTNDGVAYPPFEDMRMILQGKINVEGRDSKAVIVQRETKSGMKIMEVYEKVGVLFKNENTKEGAPDYTGKIYDTNDKQMPWSAPQTDRRIAGWRRQKDGKPYMSFNISVPQQQTQERDVNPAAARLEDDEIPF